MTPLPQDWEIIQQKSVSIQQFLIQYHLTSMFHCYTFCFKFQLRPRKMCSLEYMESYSSFQDWGNVIQVTFLSLPCNRMRLFSKPTVIPKILSTNENTSWCTSKNPRYMYQNLTRKKVLQRHLEEMGHSRLMICWSFPSVTGILLTLQNKTAIYTVLLNNSYLKHHESLNCSFLIPMTTILKKLTECAYWLSNMNTAHEVGVLTVFLSKSWYCNDQGLYVVFGTDSAAPAQVKWWWNGYLHDDKHDHFHTGV